MSTKSNAKRAFAWAAPALSILLVACAVDDGLGGESVDNVAGDSHVHVMRMSPGRDSSPNANSAPAGAKLKYDGGPIIPNVKVWAVYWNSKVTNQSTYTSFYSTITSSAYFDWLTEYNTPTQAIGHGSLGGSLVDTGAPSGTAITDKQVQNEIARLIAAGQLPTNDQNNLYMVHFPPGVQITGSDGSKSCVQFCAYHGTFSLGGKDAYYGVLPDLGGACANGCGTGTQVQNSTSVASHELIEAVTDAAVGLATANDAPPLAWYDDTNGEIGDICNAQHDVVAGFTVQKEFSNQANDCIATKGSGGAGGGGSTSAATTSATSATTAATTAGAGGAGGGGGSCSHSECTSGTKLTSGCDACATQVCAGDSFCCTNTWDGQCVNEAQACGTCGGGSSSVAATSAASSSVATSSATSGGGNCSHSECSAGAKLTKTCDPCVVSICKVDTYCCGTKWDSQCVAEVGSVCNEACP